MYGSASASIFAFRWAVVPVRAMGLLALSERWLFYTTPGNKKGGSPCGLPPCELPGAGILLDRDAPGRRRGFLRQSELEYAVRIPGLGRGLVDFLIKRERPIDAAVVALRAQQFFAVFNLFLVFHFGDDFDLLAVDRDVD